VDVVVTVAMVGVIVVVAVAVAVVVAVAVTPCAGVRGVVPCAVGGVVVGRHRGTVGGGPMRRNEGQNFN